MSKASFSLVVFVLGYLSGCVEYRPRPTGLIEESPDVLGIFRAVAADWVTKRGVDRIHFLESIYIDAKVMEAAKGAGTKVLPENLAQHANHQWYLRLSDKTGIVLEFEKVHVYHDTAIVVVATSLGYHSETQEYTLTFANGIWTVLKIQNIG